MTVAQISVDTSAASGVCKIIGLRYRESLQHSKLGFDQVDPGSFGGCPVGMDARATQQGQKTRLVIDFVEVVRNHEQPPARVASREPKESFGNFQDSLPAAEHSYQAIGMDIVESEKLLGAFQAAIGRADAMRSVLPRPSGAARGLQFQWPPIVEADCGTEGTRSQGQITKLGAQPGILGWGQGSQLETFRYALLPPGEDSAN
jgi:hypothetical protein